MSIGENVLRLRQERSISQSALAEAIDIHQTHISKIELGKKTPSFDVIRRLARYFGVPITELVNETENAQPEPV